MSIGASICACIVVSVTVSVTGCGGGDDTPYKAAPAWSGRKPSLPSPPALPTTPVKSGDAYTIYGAIHHLRSRIHEKEVNGKEIAITGYIVESNIPDAPLCAVHPTGKKDPDDCKDIPIPSFTIADTKDDAKGQKIRVLGWASNFANVYEADKKYRNLKDAPKELYKDEVWAVDVPFPLPAVGAKVKVTGKYGFTFGRSSSGLVSEPQSGVLTYAKLEVLEPAPEPAKLPKK
ncbi:hypothetical protein EON77_13745 [bacterium]|nr:MAG: hypothetical protein EON77_13745 [bacterium]